MKTSYIKCPRCELNYIKSDESFCPVCKAEMKMKGSSFDFTEEDAELELCPVCGQNFISQDQDMCEECAKKNNNEDNEDSSTIWSEDIDTKSNEDEDIEIVSLSEMQENESVDLSEDDFDDDEEEDSDKIKDEFEDDFNDDFDEIDEADFEDEEDEEDEEDDDFGDDE